MMCFRDMTFCSNWENCKNTDICGRALTPEIREAANKWWARIAPISINHYVDCYEPKEKIDVTVHNPTRTLEM